MAARDEEAEGCSKCGCWVLCLVLNLVFGAMSVNYLLESILGKHVDFWPAAIGGLFFGQVTIPSAIFCWILRLAGVEAPFIHR